MDTWPDTLRDTEMIASEAVSIQVDTHLRPRDDGRGAESDEEVRREQFGAPFPQMSDTEQRDTQRSPTSVE